MCEQEGGLPEPLLKIVEGQPAAQLPTAQQIGGADVEQAQPQLLDDKKAPEADDDYEEDEVAWYKDSTVCLWHMGAVWLEEVF